jgi:hypothetical protein
MRGCYDDRVFLGLTERDEHKAFGKMEFSFRLKDDRIVEHLRMSFCVLLDSHGMDCGMGDKICRGISTSLVERMSISETVLRDF